MIVVWGVKGGAGVTVVTALLAMGHTEPVVATSFDHDLSHVFGRSNAPGAAGLTEWTNSSQDVDASAVRSLLVDVDDRVKILPVGQQTIGRRPVADLGENNSALIVDGGIASDAYNTERIDQLFDCADVAELSLMVIRPCYLSLERAGSQLPRCDGLIVVRERWQAIKATDIEGVFGLPVLATLDVEPALARLVDEGQIIRASAHRRIRTSVQALRSLSNDRHSIPASA